MFPEVLFISLIVGGLSVDAFTVPVAREPGQGSQPYTVSSIPKPKPKREPGCELSRFYTLSRRETKHSRSMYR